MRRRHRSGPGGHVITFAQGRTRAPASSSQLEVVDDQSAVRAVISRCASESLFGDG